MNGKGEAMNGHSNGDYALTMQKPVVQRHGTVGLELSAEDAQGYTGGRVFHDDHFNHGVFVGSGEADGNSALQASKSCGEGLMHQYTNGGTAPVTVGTPMPKWPAGHHSAAFEAVSNKKSLLLSPAEIYAECAHHGVEKAKLPWYKLTMLSFIAGCFVSFGYCTCLYVGGNLAFAPAVVKAHGTGEVDKGLFKLLYGVFGFPFGFTTIMICGGELYTSLCAYMMAAWWERKVSMLTCIRMWVVSWSFNFLGCATMAGLFRASLMFEGMDMTLKAIVLDKVSHPWGATFIKGLLCNFLVGIATWMANAAQDLTGKAVGVWLPISAFAALGFEHCIANQFIFSMGYAQQMHVSAKQFLWQNLVPATLGNLVGGGLMMGTVYAMVYGSTPVRVGAYYEEHVAPKMPWAKKAK